MRAFSMRLSCLVAIATAAVLPACGGNGDTPSCPDLPIYDIRDEDQRNDPDVQDALQQAADEGCATLPGDPEVPR
jgi:hypothetical protein